MSQEQTQSKWQIFFMLIFIPIVFLLILAGVLLNFTGSSFGEQIQKVSSILPFVEAPVEADVVEFEAIIAQLEHENASYISAIENLEMELSQKEALIQELEEKIAANEVVEGIVLEENDPETRTDLKNVVRTLEAMTSSKAALIFSEMNQEEAVMYLRIMNVDARSQILGRMDAAEAAALVSLLAN